MNKYLQDLIKLSKFDTAISMFEPKIENEKAKLATFVETAESIKASINSIYLAGVLVNFAHLCSNKVYSVDINNLCLCIEWY